MPNCKLLTLFAPWISECTCVRHGKLPCYWTREGQAHSHFKPSLHYFPWFIAPFQKLFLFPSEGKSGTLAQMFWCLLRAYQRSKSKNGWMALQKQFHTSLTRIWGNLGLYSSRILFSVILSSIASPILFLLMIDSTPSVGGTTMQLLRSLHATSCTLEWREQSTIKLTLCFLPSMATDSSLSWPFALILSISLSPIAKGRQPQKFLITNQGCTMPSTSYASLSP